MTDAETRGIFAVIADVQRDIQTAEDELRAEQDAALRRYIEQVDAILAFGLPADALPADSPHHSMHLVDAVRAKLDELRLRAHLGAMDGEDLVGSVRATLRRP
jgi:hypothetical protein